MSGIASLEKKVVVETYGKLLWHMRLQPWHAAYFLSGIVVPPHERYWLGVYFGDTKENNVVASRGTSKCGALGTLVVMADGSLRKIEDVCVADQVMGPDNQPRTVTHTSRGTGKLYTVRQSSGIDYTVNDAHILSLVHKKTRAVHNIPVEDYLFSRRHVQDRYRGYRAGLLSFPSVDVPVDPYFLGLWLGDGCGRNPKVTTMDPEVIAFLSEYATRIGAEAVVSDTKSKAKNVRIRVNGGRKGNPLWQALVALGITNPRVGKGTNNKRIPEQYLVNDEQVRLQVLAGVIDSDGTISKKNFVVSQTKESLARDVKRLADWLGFRTKLRQVPVSMPRKDGTVYKSTTWRISIGGDLSRIPTRIARKQFLQGALHPNKDSLCSMVDVVPAGEGQWAGFTVGGDHLFLLEDGTVTHNSFSHASLAAPLKSLLHKNITTLTLSASGFRGGKELFKDAERLHLGKLKSQDAPGSYMQASTAGAKIIQKDPSIWTIEYRSYSRYSTVPTNQPEQLRGLRANEVLIDERNTFPGEIVQQIIRPMLNVGSDFRRTAQGGSKNKIYQVSTIDFTVRDWYPELQVGESLQRRQYAASKARKEKNWEEYDRLMADNDGQLKTASFSYTRFDYTDLCIPEFITTLDGQTKYEVKYPLEQGVVREDILLYHEPDKCWYWMTYPVDLKGLEEPWRNGTVDLEIWMAEQRNVFISSSGNVFDFDLIQRVAERPIPLDKKYKGKKEKDDDGEYESDEEFYAPVLYSCGDPCVLGIDVARESDETTFVVFRVGEMAEGEFAPFEFKVDKQNRPLLGKTSWNHICWAEMHKKMQSHEVGNKIRDLFSRFNIVSVAPSGENPEGTGGIAIDQKGGGSAVRDDLGNPKPPVGDDGKGAEGWTWDSVMKYYDPSDTQGFGHYIALNDPEHYWGGLRLINAQNQDNVEWTFGIRALMQTKKLYIGYWLKPSKWTRDKGLINGAGEPDKTNPEYVKWKTGYDGIARLKMQLLRIQMKVSENGTMRFVMPGDRAKEEGKKDFWAATIYGGSLLRRHLNGLVEVDNGAPLVMPLLVQMEPGPGLNFGHQQGPNNFNQYMNY